MEGIEKLRWAKRRLEEQTEGKQRLTIGAGGHLLVKVDDSCLAACYFAMVRNQKIGQYHADVKGYLRTFSGYCNGTRLEQLSEEISGLAALVKELEGAQLRVKRNSAGSVMSWKHRKQQKERKGRRNDKRENQWESGGGWKHHPAARCIERLLKYGIHHEVVERVIYL